MSDVLTLVVDEIRELVGADGGDVEVVSAAAGRLHVALVLPDEACRECVLPRPMLEQIAADLAAKHGAPATEITIDDPRES